AALGPDVPRRAPPRLTARARACISVASKRAPVPGSARQTPPTTPRTHHKGAAGSGWLPDGALGRSAAQIPGCGFLAAHRTRPGRWVCARAVVSDGERWSASGHSANIHEWWVAAPHTRHLWMFDAAGGCGLTARRG